jgi:hypothetical protein
VLKYWGDFLKQIQTDEIDSTITVSYRIDIEDITKAYRIFNARKVNMVNVFVQTKFSDLRPRACRRFPDSEVASDF